MDHRSAFSLLRAWINISNTLYPFLAQPTRTEAAQIVQFSHSYVVIISYIVSSQQLMAQVHLSPVLLVATCSAAVELLRLFCHASCG